MSDTIACPWCGATTSAPDDPSGYLPGHYVWPTACGSCSGTFVIEAEVVWSARGDRAPPGRDDDGDAEKRETPEP